MLSKANGSCHLTFVFQLVLISWLVTLSSCLIWHIICYILLSNEYGCVYASLSGAAIDLQKVPILAKKINFSDEARLDLGRYVNKRNCRIWFTENPHACFEKPTHPKRVQRYNWPIFLQKWARRDRYSQWRSLSGHVKRIFVHNNSRGRYWQHFVSTRLRYLPHSRSYTQCFAPCFWRLHYQQQSWCRLATTELWFDTVRLLFVKCRQR